MDFSSEPSRQFVPVPRSGEALSSANGTLKGPDSAIQYSEITEIVKKNNNLSLVIT